MTTICSVEGCEIQARTRGWCAKHYARVQRNGDPLVMKARGPKPVTPKQCSVEGCDMPLKSRGWCQKHYVRWRANGDPEMTKPRGAGRVFPRVQRVCQAEGCGKEFTFVDKGAPNRGLYCSLECANRAPKPRRNARGPDHALWRGGHIDSNGYRMITVDGPDGRRMLKGEHRHVMEQHIGRFLLPTETVHHGPGGKLDNRIENLELWASRHPRGQRVEDLVAFAREVLALYGDLY